MIVDGNIECCDHVAKIRHTTSGLPSLVMPFVTDSVTDNFAARWQLYNRPNVIGAVGMGHAAPMGGVLVRKHCLHARDTRLGQFIANEDLARGRRNRDF